MACEVESPEAAQQWLCNAKHLVLSRNGNIIVFTILRLVLVLLYRLTIWLIYYLGYFFPDGFLFLIFGLIWHYHRLRTTNGILSDYITDWRILILTTLDLNEMPVSISLSDLQLLFQVAQELIDVVWLSLNCKLTLEYNIKMRHTRLLLEYPLVFTESDFLWLF